MNRNWFCPNIRPLTGLLLLFFVSSALYAQDVEAEYQNFKKRIEEDPLKVTGMLRVQGSWYQASGLSTNRGVPYMGNITGLINIDFLRIKMPVMLNIGTGGTVFNTTLPRYNFVGISPKYKWVTVHAGTRSLELGKYTFSNHSFTGGGLELTPKQWRFAAFYGKLLRAKPEERMGIQRIDPVFERIGYGVKAGYEGKEDAFLIALFKAWDKSASVMLSDSNLVTPAQNVILSTTIRKKLTKSLRLDVEYAKSGVTNDNRLPSENRRKAIGRYGGLLTTNISTYSADAFDAALKLAIPKGEINLRYERVDPGFRTLGALFFQNDLQNINAGTNLRFFNRKLQIAGRLGLQQNNLNRDQSNHYNRWVGSATVNWMASSMVTVFANASNFNNVNRRASILNPATPLIVTELVLSNSDYGGGVSWIVRQTEKTNGIIQFNSNISRGQTIENELINAEAASKSINQMLFYNLQFIPSRWTFVWSLSRQYISLGNTRNTGISLGYSMGKRILKDKLDLSATVNAGLNRQNAGAEPATQGILTNMIFNAAWQINKKSSMGFNLSYLNNQVTQTVLIDKTTFSELRSALFFLYNFK